MRLLILALAATALYAQQPNTVTASVSTTQTITTGNTVFDVQFLDTSLSSTVDSAVSVLSSTGITASNLVDVSVAISQGYVVTTYNFRITQPSGQFGALRDKFIAVQRTLATSQTQALGWSGSQVPSDDELATALQQALPTLLAQAKLRATALATAMNATLGAVTTLTAPSVTPNGATLTIGLTASYAVTPNQ